MIIYSDEYCDQVSINQQHYDEFYKNFLAATYFDETKVNDLIYFAYDAFEEMEYNSTKRRLLLKIAEIADEVPLEDIMQLKHYELERLLKSTKGNYKNTFEKIESDISDKFENNITE